MILSEKESKLLQQPNYLFRDQVLNVPEAPGIIKASLMQARIVVMMFNVGRVMLHYYSKQAPAHYKNHEIFEVIRVSFYSGYERSGTFLTPNVYEEYGLSDIDEAVASFVSKAALLNPLDGFDQTPKDDGLIS